MIYVVLEDHECEVSASVVAFAVYINPTISCRVGVSISIQGVLLSEPYTSQFLGAIMCHMSFELQLRTQAPIA